MSNSGHRHWQDRLAAGPDSIIAKMVEPADIAGWLVLGRLATSTVSWPSELGLAEWHRAGVGTMALDLPADDPVTSAAWIQIAALHLRAELGGGHGAGLPVGFLGAGRSGAAGLIAAAAGGLDAVMAHNLAPGAAWSHLPSVTARTLLTVGAAEPRWRVLMARAAQLRLGGPTDLVDRVAPDDLSALTTWYRDRLLTPPYRSDVAGRVATHARPARKVASIAAAVTLAGVMSARPAAAANRALPNFAAGSRLSAASIGGDSTLARSAHHAKAKTAGAKSLHRSAIGGDGPTVSPNATGSVALTDGNGLKHFVNTNITFSTSSSASAAMSEASYTHAVNATTLNGGTTATTLNDAYDGYQSLCVDVGLATGQCSTGNANYVIYNKNGTPSTSCNGRSIDFNPQTVGNLKVSRKVFVPTNAGFARWLNVVTNTGPTAQTVELKTSNNLGSDSNTVITATSGGGAPSLSSQWVATFQNYSGTTSSDPRLGHVLQGPGASVGLSEISFVNGDDNPFWAYTFSLPAGQTAIIMNFGVGLASKAAAASASAALASLSDPHALDCMTATEKSQVVNFVINTCPTTITGVHSGTINVTSGTTCVAPGARVNGSIVVSGGASLVVDHATVTGSITASNANSVKLCGSTISGSVNVIGSTGLVLIGGEPLDNCPGNTIGGGIVARNNRGGLKIVGNHTGNAIITSNNAAPVVISGNTTG